MSKVALALLLFLGVSFSASAFVVPETPTGYVNDYAGIVSSAVKPQLEERLRLFTASTSNEIAVVTVPDLGGDTIEHYATKLFERWKIGSAKHDNGVLLLIARNEHKVRIEVGYGLEGALPDILAKDIITNQITPSFKNGDYDTGIVKGVTAIMKASFGEYQATPETRSSSSKDSSNSFAFVVFCIVLAFQFLGSVLARSKSWWAGGALGGLLGGGLTLLGVFGTTLIVGSLATVGLVLLGLLFDYIVSSTYASSVSRGGGIPWWIGGGSHGGASFGGFGGGSSGGGGASGSW